MSLSLQLITYLVRDYDEAINYFVEVIGFELLEDKQLSNAKRWVRIGANGGSQILLAKATSDAQIANIGNQTGGRVGFFLTSDNFDEDFARLSEKGVNFVESVRHEAYGRVVVFEDIYGNRWDLLEA